MTEILRWDKDGNKLWKLTKALNNEDTRSAPVTIKKDREIVTGRKAANVFTDTYEKSSFYVPDDRKQQVHDDFKKLKGDQDQSDYMNQPFSKK